MAESIEEAVGQAFQKVLLSPEIAEEEEEEVVVEKMAHGKEAATSHSFRWNYHKLLYLYSLSRE